MLEGLPDQLSPQTAGGDEPPPRRISADSFRALAARLAAKKLPADPGPAASSPEPEPAPLIAPPAEAIEAPAPAMAVIEPEEPDAIAQPAEPAAEALPDGAGETVAVAAEEPDVPQSIEGPAADVAEIETAVIAAEDPAAQVVPSAEAELPAESPETVEQVSPLNDLMGSLSAKFGAGISLRKKPVAAAADPFSETAAASGDAAVMPAPYIIEAADEEAADTARALLDIMSGGSSSQPQERALASDTLLRLIPRIPERGLVALAERLSIMEHPPALIAARLIRDPRASVAAALLERCTTLSDKDLLVVAAESGTEKLRLIARRRILSPALCEALIAKGDESVLLTLSRNTGAAITHDGFLRLCARARALPSIQAQLVTRPDTPAPIAFELFWMLQPVLRRLVLSRFLTDSETLHKILKLTMSVKDDGDSVVSAPSADSLDAFAGQLAWGNSQLASTMLAELAGISDATALRIVSDAFGEPLAVVFKVLGVSRAVFADFMTRIQGSGSSVLDKGRDVEELQNIFDQLSPNKARVLLTYWDWASQNTGPYALAA